MGLVSRHCRAASIRRQLSWASDMTLTIITPLPGPSEANEGSKMACFCTRIARYGDKSDTGVKYGPTQFPDFHNS